jgi:hypothetical protein
MLFPYGAGVAVDLGAEGDFDDLRGLPSHINLLWPVHSRRYCVGSLRPSQVSGGLLRAVPQRSPSALCRDPGRIPPPWQTGSVSFRAAFLTMQQVDTSQGGCMILSAIAAPLAMTASPRRGGSSGRYIAVRFVAANLHPDHDTIATFRSTNKAARSTSSRDHILINPHDFPSVHRPVQPLRPTRRLPATADWLHRYRAGLAHPAAPHLREIRQG